MALLSTVRFWVPPLLYAFVSKGTTFSCSHNDHPPPLNSSRQTPTQPWAHVSNTRYIYSETPGALAVSWDTNLRWAATYNLRLIPSWNAEPITDWFFGPSQHLTLIFLYFFSRALDLISICVGMEFSEDYRTSAQSNVKGWWKRTQRKNMTQRCLQCSARDVLAVKFKTFSSVFVVRCSFKLLRMLTSTLGNTVTSHNYQPSASTAKKNSLLIQ